MKLGFEDVLKLCQLWPVPRQLHHAPYDELAQLTVDMGKRWIILL